MKEMYLLFFLSLFVLHINIMILFQYGTSAGLKIFQNEKE
jgi:hypothetical protein